jgi:thymidylate synthase (FAD)
MCKPIATLIAKTVPVSPEYGNNLKEYIAYCARVSNPSNQHNHDTAAKLFEYLKKNKHWSPFEMASLVIEVNTTRDIARQLLRHRSFSFQEFSQRYAECVEEPVFSEARLQDHKNRQNSLEVDDAELQAQWTQSQNEIWQLSYKAYQDALAKGIAKEVARKLLPEGLTPSRLYVSGTIRSWLHYIDVRTHESTQKEHRELALAVQEILMKELSC